MKNHYAILGIEPTANPEDIKRAYKKLALKYHPDRNGNNPVAAENFKEVTQAYSVLSNPESKTRYDDPLKDVKECIQNLQSIFEENMEVKKEAWELEEKKREEIIKKKKKFLQQEQDLEDIIAEKKHKNLTTSRRYYLPALGTAVAGGIFIYVDNTEYSFTAFGLSLCLGLVGYLKKKYINKELRFLYNTKSDIHRRSEGLDQSFL